MKRSITLSASLAFGFLAANAQITIYSYDVVLAGNVVYQATDTLKEQMVNGINPGPSGPSQIWNFSNLLVGTVDTQLITNPAWTPSGSSFPNSNLAGVSNSGFTAYLINNASGLYIDGAYGDFTGQGNTVVDLNPNDMITSFPNTYNTTFSNASNVIMTAPVSSPPFDSVRVKERTSKTMKTDAWGSITTPLGTFNSLRQRGKVLVHDSIWAHTAIAGWTFLSESLDSSWHFSWWASGVGLPLLEFDSTEADTIRNISWLKTTPVPGSVSENSVLASVKTYPNPSAGKVNVAMPAAVKNYTAEIYSATGEKLGSMLSPGRDGSLDLTGIPNGIYFLRISSGKDIITRKIVLNR